MRSSLKVWRWTCIIIGSLLPIPDDANSQSCYGQQFWLSTWPSIPVGADDVGFFDVPDTISNDLWDGSGPPWKFLALVHAMLLHDLSPAGASSVDDKGKLLLIGTDDRYLKIVDLNSNCSQTTIDIRTLNPPSVHQIFCSGHSFLPDGKVLIAGGNWIQEHSIQATTHSPSPDSFPVTNLRSVLIQHVTTRVRRCRTDRF